nr:hypothetical protein BCU55_19550 [Shewanella sp. 10N.286.48.A6]
MFDKGVNLERTYEIDFFHLFEDEESAVKMAQEIDSKYSDVKISILVNDVVGGFDVDVYVSKTMEPTHKSITEHEMAYGEVAQKFGGKSDGWGFESEYNTYEPSASQ